MELLFAFREFDRIAIEVTEYDKKVNAKKSEKCAIPILDEVKHCYCNKKR
jgi:hypothetical protein